MAEKQIFRVLVEKSEGSAGTFIAIPFNVEEVFGGKRVPVKLWVNDFLYRSTVVRMGGRYVLGLPVKFRNTAGISAGERIDVVLERDTEPRVVILPEDFAEAIDKAGLKRTFEKMSYTHQKEYVAAIEDAKKEETRARRIATSIGKISKRS